MVANIKQSSDMSLMKQNVTSRTWRLIVTLLMFNLLITALLTLTFIKYNKNPCGYSIERKTLNTNVPIMINIVSLIEEHTLIEAHPCSYRAGKELEIPIL